MFWKCPEQDLEPDTVAANAFCVENPKRFVKAKAIEELSKRKIERGKRSQTFDSKAPTSAATMSLPIAEGQSEKGCRSTNKLSTTATFLEKGSEKTKTKKIPS
ncbi:hypothetical protein PoB_004275900 [Plakobranchus ocellatus]|uniref:Uncharacterized protein n=1 Tax=Plakobranchus ocellatus TaxID=259542 RepID=A0AAV4BBY5_9GAST|nr:hypothetical protein PoB_004275900 [Plakobranchus ocellatus]